MVIEFITQSWCQTLIHDIFGLPNYQTLVDYKEKRWSSAVFTAFIAPSDFPYYVSQSNVL